MKNKFIISEVADVIITDNKTGKVQFEGQAKTHNINKETDEVITFITENYSTTLGFDKNDEKFQKFVDELNSIGCLSFSSLALGAEVFKKDKVKEEIVEYSSEVQLIVDTIKDYEKEVRKEDLSNGITDVSYHNGIYRAIEDILEIVKFSVR